MMLLNVWNCVWVVRFGGLVILGIKFFIFVGFEKNIYIYKNVIVRKIVFKLNMESI